MYCYRINTKPFLLLLSIMIKILIKNDILDIKILRKKMLELPKVFKDDTLI